MPGLASPLHAITAATGPESHPLPRPGIFFGPYPCRQETTPGLENCLQKWSAGMAKPESARRKNWPGFTAAVKQASTRFEALDERALDKRITEVARALRVSGMDTASVIDAFALIREVAWRTLGLRHYDCQLIGGWVMLQGMVAEMQTGEGKTFAVTLPAGCAALAGIPVHIATANDYLVERDACLMRAVFERLGLSVGRVLQGMDTESRKRAWRCDVTYCTGKELVFDYLRDRRLLRGFRSELDLRVESLCSVRPARDRLLLRGLNYAIVDEADNIFIDEARTPLILAGKSAATPQEDLHREAVWLAREFDEQRHYVLDAAARSASLTQAGRRHLERLTSTMQGIWRGPKKSAMLVEQALVALHLFLRDIDYIVQDGNIRIIDANTGRSMPDRSWEAGLHQMIEEKEGLVQSRGTETLARISYQRFFRRYLWLAGMTGTAREVKSELLDVYGLRVVPIPTRRPVRRRRQPDYVYATEADRWRAVLASIRAEHGRGRPVLVGTRTVADSEKISRVLSRSGMHHVVLNAKQDSEEAQIVARAGQSGRITVATNMAGRGTDIKPDKAAIKAGGLHVISCEKNPSGRIDRQLAGRCARQGDPGSFIAILSLDDSILQEWPRWLKRLAGRIMRGPGLPDPQWPGRGLLWFAQKIMQRRDRRGRRDMMHADSKRDAMLALGGRGE